MLEEQAGGGSSGTDSRAGVTLRRTALRGLELFCGMWGAAAGFGNGGV